MNVPLGIPNCPPGLEYLTTIDQLLVKQKVELLEAFTGFETNNKFTIKNSLGQKVRLAELFSGITCQQFDFFLFFIQFWVGILGCWRYRLLYAQLLRSSSTIRYENNGHLPERSHSFVPSSGVFQLLLPVLLAKYGSLGTTRKQNRFDRTGMVWLLIYDFCLILSFRSQIHTIPSIV